jgi:hypothetical protein
MREPQLNYSFITLDEHIMLFDHSTGELYLPLYAVPQEDLMRDREDIDVKIKPAVVKWEGMTFISATMAQEISPDNAGDYAMIEKIIKEKLGEEVNN